MTPAAAIIALLATPVSAMDVSYDVGGHLTERRQAVLAISHSGEPVRIVGTCKSACTMYLALDDVCVTPDARLTFHGPGNVSGDDYGKAVIYLAAHYPPVIQEWFTMHGGHLTETTFTGSDVARYGVEICK